MAKTLLIEYLYLDLTTCDRCLGTDAVLDEVVAVLKPALELAGYAVDYQKREMTTAKIAEQYKFLSSPTIRVNGRDIFGEVKESDCGCCGDIAGVAVNCRVFEYEGKTCEVPTKEMLADLILKNLHTTPCCCGGAYALPENLKRFYEGKERKTANCTADAAVIVNKMEKSPMHDIHDQVRQDYTKILLDPKNSILTGDTGSDTMSASVGYTPEELAQVPAESNLGLGCGNPHRAANLQPGEYVIDLGSGAGLDCFLAGVQVGRRGKAVGVDMTPDMLSTARRIAKENRIRNVEFRLGEIENLPAADNFFDVCISNCVINMSPNKAKVYREIFRVLKPGGRISICDIVIMKQIPEELQNDPSMHSC